LLAKVPRPINVIKSCITWVIDIQPEFAESN
jgi:hypothetical protein